MEIQPPPIAEASKEKQERALLKWFRKLFPAKNDNSLRIVIEELMEEGEKDSSTSSVALHERKLIENILGLRDLPVDDVMIPRADIVAVDIDITQEQLFALLRQKPHSRIPIYKGDMDNIVGAIHMKDLVIGLAAGEEFQLRDIMRDVLIVSPAMRAMDLFLQMRQSKVHMAMVIDEFGGIDGLITINDLIEAVVGEIDDEFDFEIEPQLIERPDGSLLADARYPIDDFEERYGHILTEEERENIETIGGLVVSIAGRVPSRGEVVQHQNGMEFEVIDADPRRVMRVRLRNVPLQDSLTSTAAPAAIEKD